MNTTTQPASAHLHLGAVVTDITSGRCVVASPVRTSSPASSPFVTVYSLTNRALRWDAPLSNLRA